ncbi:Sodium/potassium/calcium exchanger 4 [Gracilariopsis chorda]|uniref:Sodium/potassium/calcium exchanger 4 n=1 Tax=Gracilariopsis chorda TaxID=448386 RepID=A0A2V3J2W8_9FLOR|nr:Sodium/potassium/calcium exchanger 4 [Gracilariopsis chorda]|eukprot:PXF48452.1 Sodium/potassium/calcium exchanger 4 [Gracilariopsis chorda]
MSAIAFRYRHPRRRRYSSRDRKSALPYASLLFLTVIAVCAVFYRTQQNTHHASAPDALLDIVSVRSGADYGNLCSGDNVFSKKWSLAFLIPAVVFTFVGLAIVTDDYFVPALECICERLNLSEDVAGATFMAAGSSTPEFFASLLAVFVTKDEVGIGTIVGSAVFNILVIIGLSAALAGAVIKLDWRPLLRDSAFYIASIILLLLFVIPITNGQIDWWEGLILVLFYGVYVLFMAFLNKPYMKWADKLNKKRAAKKSSIGDLEAGTFTTSYPTSSGDVISTEHGTWSAENSPPSSPPSSPPALETTVRSKFEDVCPRSKFRTLQYAVIAANRLRASAEGPDEKKTFLGLDLPESTLGWIFFPATGLWKLLFRYTVVDCSVERRANLWWLTFITSIVWISGISYVMVEAARIVGCLIGIPATIMGLTVLAAGTSVPDALASISVARNGAGDMAVSNAIGSNVFDILLGLGFPWFLGHLILKEQIAIPVEPITTVVIPIVILFAIMVALVIVLIALRWQMRPLLGYILFGLYGAFIVYSLLDVWVFNK